MASTFESTVSYGDLRFNISILALKDFNDTVVSNREECSHTLESTQSYPGARLGGRSNSTTPSTGLTERQISSTIPPALALLLIQEDFEELGELFEVVSEIWTTSSRGMLLTTLETLQVELSDKEEEMVTSSFSFFWTQ